MLDSRRAIDIFVGLCRIGGLGIFPMHTHTHKALVKQKSQANESKSQPNARYDSNRATSIPCKTER